MIERAVFGRTGSESSRVIFGAAALWSMEQAKAEAVLDQANGAGINHIDTAAQYGDSELRVGAWLRNRGHRAELFLATKTGERTADSARRELERSLDRLQVDSVDLIQLHNLVEEDEWAVALGAGGALEALTAARDEGLVRFIGVTGHGNRIARMHVRSLERFPFDSVLLPYSYAGLRDHAYRCDVEELLAICEERQVAVQTIKAVARRRWPPDFEGRRFSWYEPLFDAAAIDRAVRWVLARPQLFLNSSSDARTLPAILAAASAAAEGAAPPADGELDGDAQHHGVEALFDGSALDRI